MSGDARTAVRGFITARFPDVEFEDHEDIFALGFINSLFAMELVMFTEKEFGVVVSNDELNLDNFRTIDAVTGLVDRLRVRAGDR